MAVSHSVPKYSISGTSHWLQHLTLCLKHSIRNLFLIAASHSVPKHSTRNLLLITVSHSVLKHLVGTSYWLEVSHSVPNILSGTSYWLLYLTLCLNIFAGTSYWLQVSHSVPNILSESSYWLLYLTVPKHFRRNLLLIASISLCALISTLYWYWSLNAPYPRVTYPTPIASLNDWLSSEKRGELHQHPLYYISDLLLATCSLPFPQS